jgi:hypothetical protein
MAARGGLDYVTDDLPSGTWIECGVQRASLVLREYPSGCDLDSRRPQVRNLGTVLEFQERCVPTYMEQ